MYEKFKFSQDWELLDSITPPFECFDLWRSSAKQKKKKKKCRDMVPYDWPKCREVKPNKKAGHIVSIDSHSCFPNLGSPISWSLESRIRCFFVQCPMCAQLSHPTQPQDVAARQAQNHLNPSVSACWLAGLWCPACLRKSGCLPKRKSTITVKHTYAYIYGPGASLIDHQPCLWSR